MTNGELIALFVEKARWILSFRTQIIDLLGVLEVPRIDEPIACRLPLG